MKNTPDDTIMARTRRWAALAAARGGGEAGDHLGEAWITAQKPSSNADAIQAILQSAAAGAMPVDTGRGVDPDAIDAETELAVDTMSGAYRWDERRKLNRSLLSLTPREHRVLLLRFGMVPNDPEPEPTLLALGEQMSVGPERIRQMEAKALRKLKHPSRSRPLRALLPPDDSRVVERRTPETMEQAISAVTPAQWRRSILAAGGDPYKDLWQWHGCPVVRTILATGAMRHPQRIAETRPELDQYGRPLERKPESIGDIKLTCMLANGIALASTVVFPRGATYTIGRWRRHRDKLIIRATLTIPTIPETLAGGLAGRSLRDVVDHWATQGDMQIEGVDTTATGTILRLLGSSAQIAYGAGRYSHPAGLSAY